MEFNVSDNSLAFSDVVGPTHVSGLESFSDFEVGSEYESFEDQDAHDSGVEEESVTPQAVDATENGDKDVKDESFSIGASRLPSGDIREFLNALESAKAQLGMAISSQELESPINDESSLGILNLDSMHESSAFNSNQSSPDILSQLKTKPNNDQIELRQENNVETLPYDNEYNPPIALGQDFNGILVQENIANENLEKTSTNTENGDDVSSLQLSQNQDELQLYMLQTTRASSGDGGELIDRVSLSSSINFLQSQTFPESLFSSTCSYTRGSGSSNGNDDDNTLSLIHDAGDGSNGQSSVGRPGLEGANSDPEDGFLSSGSASTEIAGSGVLELRQSGEGVDVPPDMPGDGGGGGDGSSGHESDDDDDDDDDDDNQPTGSSDNISSTRSSSRSSVSSCSDQYVPVAAPQPGATGMIDIAEGRGPPVGHASTDGSPPLIPSPQRLSGNFGSTSLNQLDVLAASTPMVRPVKNTFQFDSSNTAEVSGINAQYLFATQGNNNRPGVRVTESSFISQQDGSFHLSQVFDGTRNKEETDVTLTDVPSLTPRPQLYKDHDKTLTPKASLKNNSQPRDTSNQATIRQQDSSLSFPSLYEEISNTDNSLLWKSTPRDAEEEGYRSTPGIVFAGKDRPSPVMDDHDSSKVPADTIKRLQTPGGSEEQTIPFLTLSQNTSHQHYNPFEDDGSLQQFEDFNNIQDGDFVSGDDAMAILDADEKSFEKEHQFDAPVNPEQIISSQDWTVASDRSVGRRSQIVGVNDPNNEGEVRISFGAFIAAGSEELGSLAASDPNRPRPHFGDGTITTPSPKAPFRLVPLTDLTDNDIFDHHTADDLSLYQPSSSKQTNISDIKEPKTVKKAPKSHANRKGSSDAAKKDSETGSEPRKTVLDDIKRPDSGRERRSSQGSTHSSHSSGSKSSVPSVVRKDKKESLSRKEKSDSKPRRHRTHREPDGCPSKENINNVTQPPQASQPSSLPGALKDKKNVIDGKGGTVGVKKMQQKTAQRTKSEGQDSDGDVKARQPSVSSTDDTISSILTTGSINFTNQQLLAELIAKAVNVSPEQIGHLLHAAADAKSKLQETKPLPTTDKMTTSEPVHTPPRKLDATAVSPELDKLQQMKPIASSSPHNTTAPVSTTATTTFAEFTTPPNDGFTTNNYSIDGSVFVEDSPDNVSVVENTLISPPSEKRASPPPDPFTNAHIYPTFGKTYTVKDKKIQGEVASTVQNVAIDEKTLFTDFMPVNSVSICSAGSDSTLLESPEKYSTGKHDRSYDGSGHATSPHTEQTGRHSWPKTYTESPHEMPAVSQHRYLLTSRLQSTDYNRPITIGVPAHNIQNQAFPRISPHFPGQTNAFNFQQAFGPPSGGLGLGLAHGQYPQNMFPHDAFSAPGYIGPINQPHIATTYGFYTGNQQPQPHTVSSGLGTRLATATVPWQPPNILLGNQPLSYATAPPLGLLQLGQPMGTHGARSGSTDSQFPVGPQTRLANALTPIVIPGEVKLPPVCPVGVSTRSILTLHNSSSKWIYCMVKVAYCTVNGAQVSSSCDQVVQGRPLGIGNLQLLQVTHRELNHFFTLWKVLVEIRDSCHSSAGKRMSYLLLVVMEILMIDICKMHDPVLGFFVQLPTCYP